MFENLTVTENILLENNLEMKLINWKDLEKEAKNT